MSSLKAAGSLYSVVNGLLLPQRRRDVAQRLLVVVGDESGQRQCIRLRRVGPVGQGHQRQSARRGLLARLACQVGGPLGRAHPLYPQRVVVGPRIAAAPRARDPALFPELLGIGDHAVQVEDHAVQRHPPATSNRTRFSFSSARRSAGTPSSTITRSNFSSGTSRCSATLPSLLWSSSR